MGQQPNGNAIMSLVCSWTLGRRACLGSTRTHLWNSFGSNGCNKRLAAGKTKFLFCFHTEVSSVHLCDTGVHLLGPSATTWEKWDVGGTVQERGGGS